MYKIKVIVKSISFLFLASREVIGTEFILVSHFFYYLEVRRQLYVFLLSVAAQEGWIVLQICDSLQNKRLLIV